MVRGPLPLNGWNAEETAIRENGIITPHPHPQHPPFHEWKVMLPKLLNSPLTVLSAVIWLSYCRYGVKHFTIDQSITVAWKIRVLLKYIWTRTPCDEMKFLIRRYMAEILPLRRKTLYNRSINHCCSAITGSAETSLWWDVMFLIRRYMAEILPLRRKTPNNQSNNLI